MGTQSTRNVIGLAIIAILVLVLHEFHDENNHVEYNLFALSEHKNKLAECIEHGQGSWYHVPNATEAYLLSPTLYGADFFSSEWFWGKCDKEKVKWQGNPDSIPTRDTLRYRWRPEGPGCSAFMDGRKDLPDFHNLAKRFCERFNGKAILFVGDSLSGQFFSSFISLFGVQWAMVHDAKANGCYLGFSAKDFWQEIEKNPHEIDAEADICKPFGSGSIHARFMRNDWLLTSNLETLDGVSCDWVSQLPHYDMVVLNRGIHYVEDEKFSSQLSQTISSIAELLGGSKNQSCFGSGPKEACILYRGSHHATTDCAALPDPSTTPIRLPDAPQELAYHWHKTDSQNQIAKDMITTAGGAFMDTYYGTRFRPGGRNTPDCLHWCLPSPMDEYVRVMLQYWIRTLEGPTSAD